MKRNAFTLMELMMVTSILSFVAAIVAPRFADIRERAQIAEMKVDLRHLVSAEEYYLAENQRYATDLGGSYTVSPDDRKPTITLNFIDVQTNSAFTGSQNQRPKLGDRAWFRNNTYKWRAGKRGALVGHTDGTVVVLAGSLAELSAVAYLPGGTLDALGENNFNGKNATPTGVNVIRVGWPST